MYVVKLSSGKFVLLIYIYCIGQKICVI